jgi:hypothetical protein
MGTVHIERYENGEPGPPSDTAGYFNDKGISMISFVKGEI